VKRINASGIDGKAEGKWNIDLSEIDCELTERPELSLDTGSVTTIRGMKKRLKTLGLYIGHISSSIDNDFTAAVKGFQCQKGLDETGLPENEFQEKLDEEYKNHIQNEEQNSGQDSPSQDDNQTDEIKFIFTADSFCCEQVVSNELTVGLNYLEIELVDNDGNAMPNEPYEVVLPNGRKKTGWLNDEGYARVLVSNPDECQVIFPSLDEGSWEKE
jgi:hypothetical protein